MAASWEAPQNVFDLVQEVQSKYHSPRLDEAAIAVAFVDSKPFLKNRLNLGKVNKFSEFNKLWQMEKYDFCITICADLWHSILDTNQKREALVDLQLNRCTVEYVPEVVIENKKKKVVKDEYGRIKYTNEVKLDKDGNIKWRIEPLDLVVFAANVRRYGLWYDELSEFSAAIRTKDEGRQKSFNNGSDSVGGVSSNRLLHVS